MLFRETVAVYCENRTEHTNTLRGQNAEFWYVKASGTYASSNHWASNVNGEGVPDQSLTTAECATLELGFVRFHHSTC
jgi:hypothetical protein